MIQKFLKVSNSGNKNDSGFSLNPAGLRFYENGRFTTINKLAYFWAGNIFNEMDAYGIVLDAETIDMDTGTTFKIYGFSVRCIKD